MIPVKGKYSDAIICCREDLPGAAIEKYALSQVQMICDTEILKGSRIRVMPDVHPGKTGPIGLTMTVGDAVIPGLIGVDIGCGVTAVRIGKFREDFKKLDTVIRESVPAGFGVRKKAHSMSEGFSFEDLRCEKHIRKDRALLSLGSLGGGNHFIEIDRSEDGETYLIVHSGSRHLGKEAADHYMDIGAKILKDEGRDVPYEMTYLTGELREDYLYDLGVTQEYAALNRRIIVREICKGMKWKAEEEISCIHNYIDLSRDTPILRKGAISAKKDETVSGMHTVSEFKSAMKGIYSSCIGSGTLDEAPFAYRGIDYLKEAVRETVRIEKIFRPVYSFKGGN
ncbi:MAG: RtcB family protein [Lachnospiraceae bacterium]|nr:RtcB family protein [Lachnospiraceae bacterium]